MRLWKLWKDGWVVTLRFLVFLFLVTCFLIPSHVVAHLVGAGDNWFAGGAWRVGRWCLLGVLLINFPLAMALAADIWSVENRPAAAKSKPVEPAPSSVAEPTGVEATG